MAFIIIFLTMMVIGIIAIALTTVGQLREENKELHIKQAADHKTLKNHQTWIAKLAKMEPMDALAEIRKVDNYNQRVEGDRTY